MIEGATRLLAQKGLQETSFTSVLELTGAPRGSIYHYFPGGKDQLIGEAIDFAGARAIALLESRAGASAVEITELFLSLWRQVLTRSQFTAGCSVTAVTVATDSPALLERTGIVFRDWRAQLARLLSQGGIPAADADRFAVLLIAASEGAVILSRSMHNIEPFDGVAAMLTSRAGALSRE
jgi:AcrR family transcriptional regulator